jgi:hypothetical protein
MQVKYANIAFEATKVLKFIHRGDLCTRLQQLESIDNPMLLKSLREQH